MKYLRGLRPTAWRRSVRIALGVLAGLIIFSSGAFGFVVVVDHIQQNCTAVRGLEHVLSGTIKTSLARTGKPGTPGYAYYLAHPTELAQAQAAQVKLLAQLDSPACPRG